MPYFTLMLRAVLVQAGVASPPNDCDNRAAAVDRPFKNALSAAPRSSLGYVVLSSSSFGNVCVMISRSVLHEVFIFAA